jgi:hypothetical protein
MRANPLYAECIQRAALLLGGYRELGARVCVAPRLLERWGRGQGVAPERVFLKVVDILLEENVRSMQPPGAKDGPAIPTRS